MEAIPEIFCVEDSDELDESLQEDAQVGASMERYHGNLRAPKATPPPPQEIRPY